MLHSGIDLHKRTVVVSTVDADDRPVRDAQLPTRREAVTRYFAALDGGSAAQRAVVESTSTWYWPRDLLVAQGVDLRLGHSRQVKAISYATVKTDAVDAATLAQLLRSDLIPEAHMVSAEWREARDLLRARLQLVRQQVRCKNAIDGLLAPYDVTAPAALPPLVQLRVRLLQEQLTLLGARAKRLAAELTPVLIPVLIPTPDVQRLFRIPGSAGWSPSPSSSRSTASAASRAPATSSPTADSCPAPATRAVARGTSARRTATATSSWNHAAGLKRRAALSAATIR